MTISSESVSCAICGNTVGGGAAYCPSCGAPGPGASTEQRNVWRTDRSQSSEKKGGRKGMTIGLVALALVVGIAALVFVPPLLEDGQSIDTAEVENEIGGKLQADSGLETAVDCEGEKVRIKAGKIFDCIGTDSTGSARIRVTFDDAEGHYRWEVVGVP